MKLFLIVVLLLGVTHLSIATTAEADATRQQATRVLNDLKSWENIRIKQALQHRMSENQFMLTFILEHHDQLPETEIDSSYKYAVESLLKDQAALIYISKNLSKVAMSEELKLDEYFSEHVSFAKDIEQTLANNLRKMSGKALVNRVLYYSLINKYPVI